MLANLLRFGLGNASGLLLVLRSGALGPLPLELALEHASELLGPFARLLLALLLASHRLD